jgi:hypothetical protein
MRVNLKGCHQVVPQTAEVFALPYWADRADRTLRSKQEFFARLDQTLARCRGQEAAG